MIVRRFLSWVRNAPAGARAEATSALARAYLYSELDDAERGDAEVALTSMLDDPSPLVRRALAEAFASAREAPHHCVSALAADQSDIASIVLSRSPLLSDEELVDCAALGDVYAQSAIALRPGLSQAVSAALAEVAAREALISLAVNPAARVSDASLRRMLERFGDDGEMREAILSRPDVSPGIRADLMHATADALANFVIGREWMPEERARRVAREATEKGVVVIALKEEEATGGPSAALARRLRIAGRLTAGVALRALLSGNRGLLEAVLCELTGIAPKRVSGLVDASTGPGFAALYIKAGLPPAYLPAFRAALAALRRGAGTLEGEPRGQLSRHLVTSVRLACDETPDAKGLMSMLRRYEAEAAREEARQSCERIANREIASPVARIEIDLAAIEAELAAA